MSKKTPVRSNIKRIIFVSIFPLIILVIIFNFFVATKYTDRLYSPTKEYFAQIEQTDGGATTAYQSSVGVADAKFILGNFNLLSTWLNYRKYVFSFKGQLDDVDVLWLDNTTLKILYRDCNEIPKEERVWKDVKIIFEC